MRGVKDWIRLSAVCLILAAGCGKSEIPEAAKEPAPIETAKNPPPASIGTVKGEAEENDADLGTEPLEKVEPHEGSPEWLIREATKLRLQSPKTEDVEQLKASRIDRNEKIITLSQQAIALTHTDKAKERLFTVAVNHLMEARLQLALLGGRESIDALYEDAAALESRDPQSQAAAEGAYALVTLAYSHARNVTQEDPRWLQEFAGQAMHFAGDYPKEEPRSLPLLFTAARSCELFGLMEESLACYDMIIKKFPKSPYAARTTAILRRLKLPGNPAQLGGPTLDGNQISVDDLLGQTVLVVFWAADAKPFQEQLPQLLAVQRKHARNGLTVLGVNLDQDATAVQQFLVKSHVAWPQIFFAEADKRGWNNPLAAFYGILEVPAYWLIDTRGNVVSTSLSAGELDAEISRLTQK